jgi:hydroxyacyl-ACP dehydratase HTD2-like protein with hotdog domain
MPVSELTDDPENPPAHFAAVVADWTPPEIVSTDVLTPGPVAALAALFDQPDPAPRDGDPLPPLWHWLYFAEWVPQSELGPDGHPRDGAFLPPLPERRRMFGGGRLTVHAPLRRGDTVTRRAGVAGVRTRRGGSGWLLLVTVRYEFSVGGEVLVVEEQDIVYRDPRTPSSAPTSGAEDGLDGPWRFELVPDPVLLFRFSALTANAHRIHYDLPYATQVEGYPGLLVHGPLLALSLLELPRRFAGERAVREFTYRARRPVFAGRPIIVRGGPETDTGVRLGAGGAFTGTARLV